MIARRRFRVKMGAKDRNERNTNFSRSSGEVRRDEMVCEVGDGVEATV